MENKDYRVDIHYEDNNRLRYGDFALGVGVGCLIIPSIYGIYSRVKKLTADAKARKNKEANEK